MLAGELHEDTRIRRDGFCPMPTCGPFPEGRCSLCGKREGLDPMTLNLQMLAVAQRGGLPLATDDLSFAEWCALGVIRARAEGPRLG